MKNRKWVYLVAVIALVVAASATHLCSFTGKYAANYGGIEPLGGGRVVMRISQGGRGTFEHAPGGIASFTYTRTGKTLLIDIAPEHPGQGQYLFEIHPMRLISMGHRWPDGRLTRESGYGFCMRGTYWKTIF
jgi:hypothetical protein